MLEEYSPGDFFFATTRHTISGSGTRRAATGTDPVALSETVSVEPGELAVGVLPFDTEGVPGHIVIPENSRITGPGHVESRLPIAPPVGVRAVPDPVRHVEAVARAVKALGERGMRKVVLARALDLEFDVDISPRAILNNLVFDGAGGYIFASGLPNGRTLAGASPELLLSRTGTRVVSHPHAGSAPRSADPVTDRENAESLAASRKDHIEHAVLTEAIVETLRPFCARLDVPREPSLVSTPTMWHLGTVVTGELVDRDVTALRLAAARHPSPGVRSASRVVAGSSAGSVQASSRAGSPGADSVMLCNGIFRPRPVAFISASLRVQYWKKAFVRWSPVSLDRSATSVSL